MNLTPRLVLGWAAAASILGLACSKVEPSHHPLGDPLHSAENAYFQFRLGDASEMFDEIRTNDAAEAKDRVQAGQRLARISVLFNQDVDEARKLLTEAEAYGRDEVETLLTLAKIEREAQNYDASRAAAERALTKAETMAERHDAQTEFAWSVADEGEYSVRRDAGFAIDAVAVDDALTRISEVLADRQGALPPSLVQLKLALLLGEGPRVLEAWNSYFHVSPGSTPKGLLGRPAVILNDLLPGWQRQPLQEHESSSLILALAASRMYEAAALVAGMDPRNRTQMDPQVREVIDYEAFLAQVDELTTGFYRAHALGQGDQGAYESALQQAAASFWSVLRWPDGPPAFSDELFIAELSQRFGATTVIGTANGHFGLQMGHRVIDEDYHVEQYGKQATLNFITLDFMLSNGYSSWFWDGRANIGGWADNPTIVQVRAAYAGAGIRAWEGVTDPKRLRETEDKILDLAPVDVELAQASPFAYLPGLAARIKSRSHERLLSQLRASGFEGGDLRLAFVAEIERLDLESSILAHEGRHAIESEHPLNFTRRGATKEYLAKLSEVALSSAPFMALEGAILAPNIGDGTPHGEANERIAKKLVSWMKKNRNAIEELDPNLPYLPQLDLLTDEQLRQAFRSMDPRAS